MTNLEEARRQWMAERPQYEELGLEIAGALQREIRRAGIWAEVKCRVKEVDSLIRKLIMKPEHTYGSLGDKVGVRVIVRYRDEIDLILRIAQEVLNVSDIENTIDRLRPDVVGYRSVHAVVKFRAGSSGASHFPPDRFWAELQVRTLAQHLWAEMAHATVYKNDETLQPLPNVLKRRIYILAGVVELADEEFNRIEREIPLMPELNILKALERNHYKLTVRRGDSELSLDVIRLLLPLYQRQLSEIIARLDDFFATHTETLQHVYEQAEAIPDRSAFLFQPEVLMIYDLLESDPLVIRRAWNERYPEKELERVANAFGISFD
jgi:ppGpp synthetase/RelA/SpoT-type nucleotidyltranferase